MADNKWDNSEADGDGNNPLNWSLGRVPIGTDVAYFDNTSDTNCGFTAGITCLGFNMTADYDGDIDLGANTFAFGASGLILDGTGTFTCTLATIQVTEGDFNVTDVVTFVGSGLLLTLAGTTNQSIAGSTDNIGKVTISKPVSGSIGFNGCIFELQTSSIAHFLTFASCTVTAVGTLTSVGIANVEWDLDDQTMAAIVIARTSDMVKFTGGWTASSFIHQSGMIDPNGQTFVVTGAFTIEYGALVVAGADVWNGVSLTVGGQFTLQGMPANLLNMQADAAWTLDLTNNVGTAYNVTVDESDASANEGVTAYGSDDGGSNTAWTFKPLPVSAGVGMKIGIGVGL